MLKRLLPLLLCLTIFLTACSSSPSSSSQEISSDAKQVTFDDDDKKDTWSNDAVTLTLSGTTAVLSSPSNSVQTGDGLVKINGGGEFILCGTFEGQILINAPDNSLVHLILNGVSITYTSGAPISISNASKTVVTLAAGTENSLSDGATYAVLDQKGEPDGCLFSKDDLTVNGTGSLTVTANYNDGIKCKDTLKILDATLHVVSADDGIVGRDFVAISGGAYTITSGGDGIKSTNDEDAGLGNIYITDGTFHITAVNDGIQAYRLLSVDGGEYILTTGGGSQVVSSDTTGNWGSWQSMQTPPDGLSNENPPTAPQDPTTQPTIPDQQSSTTSDTTDTPSAKGLKAGVTLLVAGGTFQIDSSDDAVHCNGDMSITGGTFTISSGDDGMHSDSSLCISQGTITITKSYEGIESNNITISGGTITVTSTDDGINVSGGNDSSSMGGRQGQNTFSTGTAGALTITGGTLTVFAAGDGLDSNGSIVMSGGKVTVFGPTDNANGALDFNNSFDFTGGTLLVSGSSGMAQFPTSNTAVVLSGTVGSFQEGSVITITDASGNTLLTHTPQKAYQHIVLADDSLKAGETITVTIDGQTIGTVTLVAGNNTIGSAAGGMGGGMGGMGGKGEKPFDKQNDTSRPQMPAQ